MSFRAMDLAIDPRTLKRLRMAIKLYPKETRTIPDEYDVRRALSVEELGGHIITEYIYKNFPKVLELEKRIAELEKEFISEP